jgi:hypothetical protein
MGTFVSLFSLAQVTAPSFAAARLFARRQSSQAFSNCGEFSSVESYHANPSRRQRNDNTEDGPDYPCRRRRRALTGVHATQGGWVRPFDHRRRPLRFRERPHHGTTPQVTSHIELTKGISQALPRCYFHRTKNLSRDVLPSWPMPFYTASGTAHHATPPDGRADRIPTYAHVNAKMEP